MTWIILLLIVGILLVFIEIFFVPGTTFVGIIGFLFAIIGIYLVFKDHGNTAGFIVLTLTVVLIVFAIIIGAKSGVWDKLSNKDAINSKVNVINENEVNVGDKGKTLSAVRPIGKARINGNNYEVKSLGEYINPNIDIEVIKVSGNKIIIKTIEQI